MPDRRKLRPSRWPVSRNALIACAGLCGAALAPHHALAGTLVEDARVTTSVSIDDEILIALNLGQYRIADDVTAASVNGRMCVDLQQILTGLDFPIVVDKGRKTASGWFIRETQTMSLNLATGAAQVSGKEIELPFPAIAQLSTGPCMTTEALGKLLSLQFDYDPRGTLLAVSSDVTLPIIDRLSRQNRAKLRGASGVDDVTLPRPPAIPYSAFVAPNSDITLSFGTVQIRSLEPEPVTDRNSTFGWSILSVGELAFMTAEAQLSGDDEGFNGNASRVRLYRTEREGGVFGIPALTEFSVGDIAAYGSSLGSIGGVGLGITASSFPVNRPASFDRTNFEGPLPVGWDVELYRNGQLLEFANDGASGGYSFKDVPVLFGDNNFEVVQYGPQGQRRVISRRINAANFLAPKGASYYRAAVYSPDVTFATSARKRGPRLDLRAAFGIADNLNIGGGFDSYEASGRRLNVASLSAQTSLSGLALNSELAVNLDGTVAGQIEFQGNGKAAGLRGRLTLAQEGFTSERIFGNILSRIEISGDRGLNFGQNSNGSFSGRLQFDRLHSGEYSFSARQRFVLSHGNSWLSQSLAWSHTSTGERRDKIDGELAYSIRHGRHAMRAAVEYGIYPNPVVNRLSAVVERSFSVSTDSWRWRLEADWRRSEDKFTYGMALSREFKKLTFDLIAETDGKNDHRFGINLAFSLGRTSNGWGMSGRQLAQMGTLRARVFEDMDENGRFSDGDVPIQGAGVVSQSSLNVGTTDANGFATVSGISPNDRAQVTVDTDDLAANNLYARSAYILPREGTIYRLDVPMAQMGTIDGNVAMVGGFEGLSAPVGGINLALLDAQGREIGRTVSAYDGYYSFDLVPAGEYRVILAPDSSMAQILRPVEPVTIKTTRAEPTVQANALTLIETNPTGQRTALRGLI